MLWFRGALGSSHNCCCAAACALRIVKACDSLDVVMVAETENDAMSIDMLRIVRDFLVQRGIRNNCYVRPSPGSKRVSEALVACCDEGDYDVMVLGVSGHK